VGVRYIAIVKAASVFGKISAQQYITNVMRSKDYAFHTHTLPSLEAAGLAAGSITQHPRTVTPCARN